MIPDNLRQSVLRGLKRTIIAAGLGGVVLTAASPAQAVVSTDPDTVPSFNGVVTAVAYSGSTIYVGGDFTAAIVNGKQIARSHLAAVDADTGALTSWAPSVNGRVKAIAVSGSSVYIGGQFTSVAGRSRDSLARLDVATGAVSSTFKHTITGNVYALAAGNGRLYVGGAFTAVDASTRTRLAAFDLTSGALDGSWKPAADDQVEALTYASGKVYVGGKFHKIAAASGHDRLAALTPTTGAIDNTFKAKPTYITYGIAVTSDGVYSVHGGQGGRAAAWTTSGTLEWTATFDGDAQAVGTVGDTVYVGGHFDKACRSSRTGSQGVCIDGSDVRIKLAALDKESGDLQDWTANANGIDGVLTMATQSDRFAVGGAFTTINGKSQKRLAQFS